MHFEVDIFCLDAPVDSKLTASHLDVIENGKVSLTCTAVAVPTATFEFYQMNNGKKDIIIPASGSDVSGVIEITVLRNAKTKGYNNTYGCKAINSLGNSTEQQVVVNVLGKHLNVNMSCIYFVWPNSKERTLYPCGEPCSTGTYNKTVKKLTLFMHSSFKSRSY